MYEDSRLHITAGSLMWKSGGKQHVLPMQEVEAKVTAEGWGMTVYHTTRRDTTEYEFARRMWLIPAAIINRLADTAMHQTQQAKDDDSGFTTMSVSDTVASGKVCYYTCQVEYVQKVVDDEGDFRCVGHQKPCTVYVL